MTVKVKGCIFFCLLKNISEIAKKCEIKLRRAWPSAPTRFLFMQVGLDLIVLLVQMTTMVYWSLLNLILSHSLQSYSELRGGGRKFFLAVHRQHNRTLCLSVRLSEPTKIPFDFDIKEQSQRLVTVCGNGRSQLRHKMMLETCDIWYTYYNSDNWEPEFMTIFVIWP